MNFIRHFLVSFVFLPALVQSAASPLVEADDAQIAFALGSVVIPRVTGLSATRAPWSETRAPWDEYHFRVRSVSGAELRLVRITLFDALGNAVESGTSSGVLSSAAFEVQKRYDAAFRRACRIAPSYVEPAAMGMGFPLAYFDPSILINMAAAVIAATAEIARVDAELERSHTPLPAVIGPSESTVVVFFPIVAQPSAIELSYVDSGTERSMRVATQKELSQVHAVPEIVHRPEPEFPPKASLQGIDKGHVKANVYIGGGGEVNGVQIVEASSPLFIKEAKFTFLDYKYAAGSRHCVVQEVMQFRQGESR